MPLTNINNVMAEANTGKTRRLHFQDELPAGTTENTAETGQAHALHAVQFQLCLVLKLIQCWHLTFADGVKDSHSTRKLRSTSMPTECTGGSLPWT